MREVRKFQDTVKGELDEVLHGHEDDQASAPSYSPGAPSITVPDEPPALPAADSRPAGPRAPAPRAQSRFRSPEPAPHNGSSPNGAGGGAAGDASRRGGPTHAATPARSGARPPSRFRAPGPRPTT